MRHNSEKTSPPGCGETHLEVSLIVNRGYGICARVCSFSKFSVREQLSRITLSAIYDVRITDNRLEA